MPSANTYANIGNEILPIIRNIITSGNPFTLKEKFAKDKVKLFYKDGEIKEIALEKTLDAIGIVEQEKELLQGFEVIQGNMDDVFLNAVGTSL